MREVSGGGIRVDAQLTRAGVFEYLTPEGNIRREYRPPEEVFAKASMDSLDCVPVGDDHPEELLELETEHDYRRGLTGEHTRKDGDWLVNSIIVRDPSLIEKMRRGKIHVSCGYDCDLEEKPGVTPTGERYDAIQRNIVYNHVAIVDVPRAGARARVRMDAAIQTRETEMNLKQKLARALKENEALKARADAADARLDAKKKDEFPDDEDDTEPDGDEEKMDEDEEEPPPFIKKKLDAKKDAADFVPRAVHDREVARADSAEAEVKRLKGKLKSHTTKLDSADIQRRVKERVALERQAAPFLEVDREDADATVDIESMSDREVKVAVINAVEKKDCADVKRFSDDYVNARFDSIVERHDESDDDDLETEDYQFSDDRFDAADADPEAKAARKMRERSANRWQRGDAADNASEEN